MNQRNYLIMNMIFAGTILAIFIYSVIRDPEKSYYPKKCIHEELLGAACPTCGMTSGFSALIRGNISEAVGYQKNSLPVFVFFVVQLIIRMFVFVLIVKSNVPLKSIANMDITMSFILFLLTFKGLLLQSIYLFYKMLLTGNVA